MFTEKDLRELLDYQSDSPTLSVYLNIEPGEGGSDTHRLRLRSMLKEVDLPEDILAVERFIDREFDWSGRSLVIFSNSPNDFFQHYSLMVPIRSRVRVSDRPHVKPLVDLLDSYGGYGVVLFDKQGARLFSFHLGELREQDGVVGENVRRTKRGGGSQAQGRRGGVAGQTNYAEEVAERNIREVVDFAVHFFTENNVRRILLCGTEDNLAIFKGYLPKAWQSLVVGSFPISMTANHNDVLGRAMEIGRTAELRREARLIEATITSAAKGRGAVVGLDDTLSAIHNGRVQTLLIKEGLRTPGARCQGCGFLTAQDMDVCPYCDNPFEKIPDAIELAVRKVIQAGGDVEVLHEDLGLSKHGHVGALLRY